MCAGIVGWTLLAARGATGQSQPATRAAEQTRGASRGGDDAASLPVVRATLRLIRSKYVDPARLVPREMLLGALRQVEKEALPVVVSQGDSPATVVVQVNASRQTFRIDDVHGLWDVAARLREVFVFLRAQLKSDSHVDFRKLEYAACVGLLDQHDAFIVPDAPASVARHDTAGAGVAVALGDGMLTLRRVFAASPASRAGLRAHDRITKIDGKPVLEMTLDQAIEHLRGPSGSRLEVLVRRSGSNAWAGEKRFVVTREELATPPVESRELGAGVGYVRIKRFERSTADGLGQVLARLRAAGSLNGLVVDLRDNFGGLLHEAATVADAFLEDGSLVALRGASEGDEKKLAKKDGTEPQCPLVILMNSVTAAGGEIVASALKNNERAVIMGETSFGMGRIQLVFPRIAGVATLKLTIAEFQAPAGTPIQGIGVVPDIALRPVIVDPMEMRFFGPARRARENNPMQMFPNATTPSPAPAATVWHEASLSESPERVDIGDPEPREAQSDFALQLATELVTRLPKGERSGQLESARAFLDSRQ